MKYISFADTFIIEVNDEVSNKSINFLLDEFKYDLINSSLMLPVVGCVSVDLNLTIPKDAIELRKGILFETKDSLWIKNESNLIRINVDLNKFHVTIGPKSNPSILFYTVEMLIRFFSPIYGLVLLHAGGFIFNGKVNVICAFGGVGKTEVTIRAVEHGAKFLADDLIIVDREGNIFPYTKRINLCEYPYNDQMLKLLGKNKYLYAIKEHCAAKGGRFWGRIACFLEARYFASYIDYVDVQQSLTSRMKYRVDKLYWVESSGITREREICSDEFVSKMMLCLELESRRYFDYDGYLRLKYPFLSDYKNIQQEIISAISQILKVRGLLVKSRNFDELYELITSLN